MQLLKLCNGYFVLDGNFITGMVKQLLFQISTDL